MYPQPCRVLHAASQPAHIAPHSLLHQASRKVLQFQLHGATRVPAQQQQQQHQQQQQQDYEADLKQRQIAAREWIAPWLSFKAKSKSVNVLAAVRTNASDFSPQQQDSALKRLLAQSWQGTTSIFMVALIRRGVKKELPSNSALQHSLSQL
ncbi:MAG: hypothetical protein FRX49_01693 [Trebouxia sp. A1-2]|nr:MAG: hypothetical protein FRX49_01693 [Trebouxia sp. A1-2]